MAVGFSDAALVVAWTGLKVAFEVVAAAIGGDTGAAKARGLATEGCGCATGALLTGLLWRPTV